MPKDSKPFYCFDYPYTMKLTYARDLKIAELLYEEIIEKPRREKTIQKMNLWLSSFKPEGIMEWASQIPEYSRDLCIRWEITSYIINPKAFSTCVYEAESKKYGKVIIKFHSPAGRFNSELAYYQCAKGDFMAKLLDYDIEYRALLIRKVLPGTLVKFDISDEALFSFFRRVSDNFIPYNKSFYEIPTILDEFNKNVQCAKNYTFELRFREKMENMAMNVYDKYFKNSECFFLHRDLQRRNILRAMHGTIFAIDPLGVIGAKEFEYTIELIVETRQRKDPVKCHKELIDFFSNFVDRERLLAAAFFIWVHKLDEYVFCKHDDFEMAAWAMKMIKDLYFDNIQWELAEAPNFYN